MSSKEKSSSSKHKTSSTKDKSSKDPKHKSSSKDKDGHKSSSSSKSKASSKSDTKDKKISTKDVKEVKEVKETKAVAKVDEQTQKLVKEQEAEIARLKALVSSLESKVVQPPKEEEDTSTEITFAPKKGKSVKINAEWKGVSAGGSMNNHTWRYNPQIFLWPSRSATINITLSQPSEGTPTGIGFYVFESTYPTARRLLIDNEQQVAKSPFAKATKVEGSWLIKKSRNPYIIVPCTLDPDNEMPFSVTFSADAPITAQLISKEQEWPQPTILGEWTEDTAGGCENEDTVINNPQYLIKVPTQTQLSFLLLQTKFEDFDNIAFYLISTEPGRKQKINDVDAFQDDSKVVVKPEFSDPNQFFAEVNLKPGSYVLVPATFEPGQQAPFKLMIMGESEMPPVVELADAAVISINGDWEGETAGGCLNDPHLWRGNTQYALTVSQDCELTVKLKQTSAVGSDLNSIGFYVFKGGKRVIKPKKDLIMRKSKFGKMKEISAKIKFKASEEAYIIVPCTFDAHMEGSYSLSVQSDDTGFTEYVYLDYLAQEQDLVHFKEKTAWAGVTAGGCLDYATWRQNPQFLLDIQKTTTLTIFLNCLTEDTEGLAPGFYVVKAPTNMNLCVNMKKEDILLKAQFSKDAKEISKTHEFGPGRYNIIPCNYSSNVECKFELNVYSTEAGSTAFSPIPAGVLSLEGEWNPDTAGGCINDMTSWLKNPHLFLAVKQHTELAAILVQSPAEEVPENLDELLEIGMYVTNSDGDGNPKTNEANDLIAKAPFSPDKDVVITGSLPACHWPYCITPCTFKPNITGKFKITLIMDKENLEHIEFSHEPININPAEVIGAGEDPMLREIRRRFKPIASQTVELVKVTEKEEGNIPEFMTYVRPCPIDYLQHKASIVAWAEGVEPQWWLDGYDEEPVEEVGEIPAGGPPPPPIGGPPPPPPPPPKLPPINFSKPPKLGMIETSAQSFMTAEMITELEEKPKTKLFIDELLIAVKGGLSNLRKVEIPPKPVVVDPRAAIEGLHDKEDSDDWSDDEWSD